MTVRSSVRSMFRRTAISVALGAVWTVAIAWIVALTVRPFTGSGVSWSRPSGIGEVWSYWVERSFGTIEVVRVRAYFNLQPPLREDYLAVRQRTVPRWSGVYDAPRESDPSGTVFVEQARGWPLPALRTELAVTPGGRGGEIYAARGGIVLSDANALPRDRLTLPLMPIWTGLLIDWMIFFALSFAILHGPGLVRRERRRRNGRCVRCGYDLRGSGAAGVCPECGASVAKPAR